MDLIRLDAEIIKVLKDFGLSEKESEVYIFLAKSDILKGGDIAKRLKMHKAQVYSILKSLQSRGMVESTLEFPARFTAIPFEKVLDLIIKAKREEAGFLEDEKSDILAHWRSISIEKPVSPLEKFVVVAGISNIYSKTLQMISEAKEEVLAIKSSLGLIRADYAEIIEAMGKRGIRVRILTHISKENIEIAKRFLEKILKTHLNIEVRHVNLVSGVRPCFAIKDDEEGIFLLSPNEDPSVISQDNTGLWTNSKAVVHALRAFFEELWRGAIDVDMRMCEIETGKAVEETLIIKDGQLAYEKFREITDAAKEEIITLTTSKGIIRILETAPVRQCFEKGVKIRIMAPINLENLEAAQKLLKYCQVKHIDVAYVRMAIVDNKHLFQFKTPPLDNETTEPAAYFDHMLCTSDSEYIQRMSEMLNDLWERSFDISEIRSEAAMRSPPVKVSTSDPASKVIDNMLKNNIGSVLVVEDHRPIGIITEKDLLERVIKAQREPDRTYAKEIMSTPVVTIDADKPLIEALKIMRNKRIRRLAVIKEGTLAGILTERRAFKKMEDKTL